MWQWKCIEIVQKNIRRRDHFGDLGRERRILLKRISRKKVIWCQTLLEDLWTIWSCCLYVFYEYYYHISSYSLGSIFLSIYIYIYIYIYMVLVLFNNVIYVFLLLWLCILIVYLCMTTLAEVFPCFSSVVRQMSGKTPQRRGTARTLPNFCVFLRIFCIVLCIFVLFYVFLCCSMYFCVVLCIFVLFYVFLYCSMYFCVVLCIVCV